MSLYLSTLPLAHNALPLTPTRVLAKSATRSLERSSLHRALLKAQIAYVSTNLQFDK